MTLLLSSVSVFVFGACFCCLPAVYDYVSRCFTCALMLFLSSVVLIFCLGQCPIRVQCLLLFAFFTCPLVFISLVSVDLHNDKVMRSLYGTVIASSSKEKSIKCFSISYSHNINFIHSFLQHEHRR
jgi:hypothetical protein